MKYKIILSLIILIAAVAAGGFWFLGKTNFIVVQEKQITDSTNPFVVKISYPYITGLDDFNQKSKAIVDKEISDFKTNSLANDAAVKKIDSASYAKYPREYDLNIGYDKGESDNSIISTVFNVYNFEGGAHGESYFISLNYNPKTKTEIQLSDLFPNQKDYLQKISAYCIKDLTKQMVTKLGSTDGTWVQEGAGPTADNYQFFLINKNNIVFYFPQYQVAYGAAGEFKVTMPR